LTCTVSDSDDNLLATYTWLADEIKVGVVDDDGHGLEYTGSLIYRRNGNTLELESTSFGGGRIEVSEGTSGNIYTPNYFLTDHLGSTRVIYDGSTTIPRSDYFPFGGRHENPNMATSDNRYWFSGKEEQALFDLPYQDFGARFYGGKFPIFTTPDPKATDYYPFSPYLYCVGNPIKYVDPDGRKIVFVNGYLGFGSPQGGSAYWGGSNSSFVQGAQKFFNDKNTFFTNYDHNILSSSTYMRGVNGYQYAKENYKQLVAGMDPQKDAFHFISHSMGGAFSEGMIKYLKEQGWVVYVAIHLNTWRPNELKGSDGTLLIDATVTNDWVQGLGSPLNGNRDISGADYRIRKNSNLGWQYRHRDLIDNGALWDTQSGTTWNQAMSTIQSWLQQNPNIQINYGQ
jgi:RHS repeat-associated protein